MNDYEGIGIGIYTVVVVHFKFVLYIQVWENILLGGECSFFSWYYGIDT